MGRQTSPIRYRNKICHRQLDHKRVSPALPLALLLSLYTLSLPHSLSFSPLLSLVSLCVRLNIANGDRRKKQHGEREGEGEWGYSLLPSLMF